MAKMSFEIASTKGSPRLKRWLIGLFIFLLASLLAINSFTISQFRIIPFGSTSNQVIYVESKARDERTPAADQSGYLVNGRGCRIPDLSPFDPSLMRYFDKAQPIVCEHGSQLPLVDSNSSAIFVDPEARGHYYNDTEPVDCCWRAFWRADNKDNEIKASKDCHPFQEAAFPNEEFVRVECQRRNESIYRDYFAFVPRKLRVEERCRGYLQERASNSVAARPPERLGVLIVGIDSVSRLNLHRMMPRSLAALRKLGAVEMLGYNKVADNTYPNLVPVLTGLGQEQFEKLCWTNRKKPFDRCPFIWKNFMARGYKSVFAEDACPMSIFNYIKPGFRKQPTDYYLRPYCVATESDIGNTHKLNADLCVGTRLNFENLLHYTRKVAEEFADEPYFALFWQASLTHDFIEYPLLGDGAYSEFLEHLGKRDLLRNTALVFMSDHGMRWGYFRQTYQGRLEDSLPFVFVVAPDWWREKHSRAWENLKRNTRSLTTPYDLHETLRDILDPSRLPSQKESNDAQSVEIKPSARGISLFQPIPDRTCESAGIPEHWCMCHSRRNVSHDDPALGEAVRYLVDEVNRLLAPYKQCARLEFNALIDAKVLSDAGEEAAAAAAAAAKKSEAPAAPWTDYSLTIETLPGGAVLEGSLRRQKDGGALSLVGTVSRLNAYGKQSACVDDFHMRLYCYCRH